MTPIGKCPYLEGGRLYRSSMLRLYPTSPTPLAWPPTRSMFWERHGCGTCKLTMAHVYYKRGGKIGPPWIEWERKNIACWVRVANQRTMWREWSSAALYDVKKDSFCTPLRVWQVGECAILALPIFVINSRIFLRLPGSNMTPPSSQIHLMLRTQTTIISLSLPKISWSSLPMSTTSPANQPIVPTRLWTSHTQVRCIHISTKIRAWAPLSLHNLFYKQKFATVRRILHLFLKR